MYMKLIDLDKLEKLPVLEQIEIKIGIIETNDLRKIPPAYLPPVHTKDYYFVSYSHKDYKEVYKDIFALQQEGLSIWYDQGIAAGENWKDTALKYITPFDCKGVLFYISENALKSDSIKEEVEFAKNTNKPFIVVFISDDESLSLLDMIEKLYKDNEIDKERYNFYKNAFPEEVIYIKYKDNVENKVKLIHGSIHLQPVLDLDYDLSCPLLAKTEDGAYINGFLMAIRALNYYYAKSILIEHYLQLIADSNIMNEFINHYVDNATNSKKVTSSNMDWDFLSYTTHEDYFAEFISIDTHFGFRDEKTLRLALKEALDEDPLPPEMETINTIEICSAAFSNMKNLEYVEIPIGPASRYNLTNYLSEYAFYGCERLKTVVFVCHDQITKPIVVCKYAFARCKSLEDFDFSHVDICGEECFSECSSLSKVDFSQNVYLHNLPSKTFKDCIKLKKLVLNDCLTGISEEAFYNCIELKNVTFNSALESIGRSAFAYSGLKSFIAPEKLDYIGEKAFEYCVALKEIVFNKEIKRIGDEAFARCSSLEEIRLPSSLKHIGKTAFYECANLKKVYYDGESASLMRICESNWQHCFRSGTNNVEIICSDKTLIAKAH